MRTAPAVWTCALCLLAACSGPSQEMQSLQSQLADLQRQVLQLQRQIVTREDVAALEQKLAAQSELILKADADSQVRLTDLIAEVDQLRAQAEDTTYRLDRIAHQLTATHQELQDIGANLGGPSSGAGSLPSPAEVAATAEPEALYRAAYESYLKGSFDEAIRQFQGYVARFPDTDLSDNALYWLGECYYRQGKYRPAIDEFTNLLSRYPRSDKVPSAMLKKGYAYLALNERAQGVLQLQHVLREYAGSDEANLARQRLTELGIDGNS